MTLFEYFTSLAPEGETALIIKQIDTGKLHADGTPRYTWPAYMPSHKQRKGESWFINTGSFIIDRFKNGKPSASVANCTHVLFMMLDDIGTKSKTPPLAPTAVVETSPGNFQYWYAYSDQPTVEQHCAALSAIARAGYTDPGATNAVRNCRLPGSVNQKPGREAFECREAVFDPDIEYTLQEICAALGVTPDEESSRANHLRLTDTGSDDVLAWLNEQGLVTSRVNSEGWCGVVCPNHAEHTDGQLEARYMPQSRAFCCYHGHCEHLDSNYFCDWVAEQGGPKHRPGIREELIAEAMKPLSSLKPTKANPDVAAEIIAATERKQAGREARSEWHDRFAYIISDDAYFDRHTCSEISRKAFNALFKGVECVVSNSEGKKRRIEASSWFDTFREDKGAYALHGLTYAAGEDWMVTKDGLVYGNMWRDARPEIKSAGDPQQWIDHCRRLVPEEHELEHIWDVMAYKAQHPNVKINHAILHGGKGGCGKDTMWAPFIWSVCGPHEKNKGLIDNDSLTSQWGYQLESEIVVLNELKEPDAKDRRALANKLKPIIAAPPETLTINRKGLHPYQTVNRAFVLAFSNDPVPLTISSDDRRWFVLWSQAPRMMEAEATLIWRWYKEGQGFEKVARWLHDRDVSAFNPGAAPVLNDAKANLIEHSMSMAESFIVELIRNRQGDFAKGVIASPFHAVCDRLAGMAPPGIKIPQPALLHALKEAKWVDVGRIGTVELVNKKHIFATPEMAKKYSKSDLRRIVEEDAAPKVVNLKAVS